MTYILAIDQGTTGTTAALVDTKDYSFIGKKNFEYKQIYPHPGWVEHNLDDIWQTVEQSITEVLKENNVDANAIAAIGITNQRETTCLFDRKGEQLENAIVWQDRRTSDYCADLRDKGLEKTFKKKSGLPLDPYFSGTKINWFLNNSDKVKKALKEDNALFGTIDTFLLYRLTGGVIHATEASNASRTLLMGLGSGIWDKELLKTLDVPASILPQIKNSFDDFGKTKGLKFLPDGIPITGILGDQQAALFGQAGFSKGAMKCTYGTGAFILFNTGDNIVYSKNGLLSTVAYKHEDKITYALEGSCYIAGAAVQWLRDNLKIIASSSEIEKLAKDVSSLDEMKHILFLPFFAGIGSPYWIDTAKAAIVGMTRDSQPYHLARACLDGIAFSINDLVTAMKSDTGTNISELKVDGGAVANNLLMKIQATISNLNIVRPKIIETTAYGAALAAGVGKGDLTFSNLDSLWSKDKIFSPDKSEKEFYKEKQSQWDSVIKKLYL